MYGDENLDDNKNSDMVNSIDFQSNFTKSMPEVVKKKHLKIKSNLFKLINLLTEYNGISNQLYSIILFLELIVQLSFFFIKLQLLIQNEIDDTQQQNVTFVEPSKYLGYLNLYSLISEHKSEIISYVSISIVLMYLIIMFVLVIASIRRCGDGHMSIFINSFDKGLLKITSILIVITQRVLMIPFFLVLLSPLVCQTSDEGTIVNIYFTYQCWTPFHLSFTLICLLCSIFMLVFILIISMLFNDIQPLSKLAWSNQQNRCEVIKTIIKLNIALCMLLNVYADWIFFTLKIVNLLLALFLFHQRFVYFFHQIQQTYIVTILTEATYFYMSTIIQIVIFVEYKFSIIAFVVTICSIIFFDFLVLQIFLLKQSEYQLVKYSMLKQENQIEQFFYQLHKYLSKRNSKKKFQGHKKTILGLLKEHQKTCFVLDCKCSELLFHLSNGKLENSSNDQKGFLQHQFDLDQDENQEQQCQNKQQGEQMQKQKFKKVLYQFFNQLLSLAIEKNPQYIRIKMLQLYLYQNQLDNEYQSYFQVLKLMKQKPSIEWEYFLYQSKQTAEKIMYQKYQKLLNDKISIDVMKVYDFERNFIKFQKQILNTAQNCLNFWQGLMDKKLDVNRIHDFGVQISTSYSNVHSITSHLLKFFPSHILLLKIYALFLIDVMNNEEEARVYYNKAKSYLYSHVNAMKNSQDEEKNFGYNTKSSMIIMTVTQKDIGNIVNANFEIMSLLGYKNKEIINKNVRILMPKILSENHDLFIKNYFNTAKAKILEQKRQVFAKNKEGYIIPVHILVKAIPNLKQNLTFIGFLKRLEMDDPYMQPPTMFSGSEYHIILADNEGSIQGFTPNCWETFGFQPNFFFNRFGDPDQQIRDYMIIKNLREEAFMSKIELKKEGCFSSLDTFKTMEFISKELLNKEDQQMLLNISGSYNINLQIDEESFSNGKINLKIYKIIKLSRIIRSHNVLGIIQDRIDDMNDSFASSFDEAEHNNVVPQVKKLDSIDFDDEVQSQGTDNIQSIVQRSIGLNIQKNNQYLQNFKRSISSRKMPHSIRKLNKVVYLMLLLIIVLSFLDFLQTDQFYSYSEYLQYYLQEYYKAQNILGQVASNLLVITLIINKKQPNSFESFPNLVQIFNQSIIQDTTELQSIYQSLQKMDLSRSIYVLNSFEIDPAMSIQVMDANGKVTNKSDHMMFSIYRYLSSLQTLVLQRNYSDLNLIPHIYSQSRLKPQKLYSESEKDMFLIIQNSLLNLNNMNRKQTDSFIQSIYKIIKLYNILLIVAFAFFIIFVLICGSILFPIMIGVQKNKVMILSIYFKLPSFEIIDAFNKCNAFVKKLEQKFNESLDKIEDEIIVEPAKISQEEGNSLDELNRNDNSGREFIDVSLNESKAASLENKSSNEKEVEEKNDHEETIHTFNKIKLKNKKVNVSIFGVILIFIGYFSLSFGLTKSNLTEIDKMLQISDTLYSQKPNLQYVYLFFLQNVMRNTTIRELAFSDIKDDYFSFYFEKVKIQLTKLQELRTNQPSDLLSGNSFNFINKIEKASFCDVISQHLVQQLEREQCGSIGQGEFLYGQKYAIQNFIYQISNLHMKYQTESKILTPKEQNQILNNTYLKQFSIESDVYYRASFWCLMNNTQTSIHDFYKKVVITKKLLFSFFVIFTIFTFSILWRIFQRQIQDEVLRSKGMLNMIPTQFLEKESNLKKISIDKIIDMS